MPGPALVRVEKMSIPTYPIVDCCKMPMFNENRNHQGMTGNTYPIMPVLSVKRENCQPREYEVIRLENDYIRLILIPELGGRVFEAYDKKNQYDFLYRQHVIKPALIGDYGLWISGGLEFNWPWHHRPSTFMPVNFTTETQEDGTVIAWLSECDPLDRTRCTVGIVLHPGSAYFETRVQVTNRTPLRHSFLMWQNAAVSVNDQYQFIFPPDVNYVNYHHFAGRIPTTYPMAYGDYSNAYYDEPTDISWYKNCFDATSHFAAPSKYDFFGGYDHGKQCGVIHVADHHVSPGKKMFTWGHRELAKNWETALTDEDGPYCELMAGSYSNNQPDFTWLEPYETKRFSQFWYPIGAIGKASFATLDAAVTVCMKTGTLRLQTTSAQKDMLVRLKTEEKELLCVRCDTEPGAAQQLNFPACEGMYSIELIAACGKTLLAYQQEEEKIYYPEPVALRPHPDTVKTVQELYLQGVHIDQYHDMYVKPDVYFEEALRRDPDHIPTLTALGEYCYRRGFFDRAKELLEKAVELEHSYNLHYPDGSAQYLLGLTLDKLGEEDRAYDTLRSAAWSGSSVAKAMSKAAAIAGRRGDYADMLKCADTALEAAVRHPLASAYAALALAKMGNKDEALRRMDLALRYDPLNDLAQCVRSMIAGESLEAFKASRRSDFSQTALDIAYDLMDAGCLDEAKAILLCAAPATTPLVPYTIASILDMQGEASAAMRAEAAKCRPQLALPYRLEELRVLEEAVGYGGDASACDLLACELYDKGHYARAAGLWESACQLEPQNALYTRNLAVALFSHMDEQQRALELLEKAIGLDPANDQLKLEYLYAATKSGAPCEERLRVIKTYPCAQKMADDYAIEYAKTCCYAGLYDKALEILLAQNFVPAEGGEKAITGLYFSIILQQARRDMDKGELDKALGSIDSLLGSLPENFCAGIWTESDYVPVHYYKAVCLEKMGRREESLAEYELTLKRFDTSLSEYAFYYADAMRALGRHTDARIYINQQMRRVEETQKHASIGWEDNTAGFNTFLQHPQRQREGMAAYWKSQIERYLGHAQRSLELLEQSRRLWPENLSAWIELDLSGR